VLSGLRKVRRLRERETDFDQVPEPPDRPRTDTELQILLHAAIDALPADLRVVFLMHDLEGFKHREIAVGLAISEGTAKSRLHRAHAWLRDYLYRCGCPLAEEDVS